MKREKRESGLVDGVVVVATIFGAFLAVGLFIPALRPLALQLGTGLALFFIAGGFGVAVYAAWRIVTFPSRSRKAVAQARSASATQLARRHQKLMAVLRTDAPR